MWLLAAVAGIASGRTIQLDHRVFPGLERMDKNWAALFAASHGKVYAGLAYHGATATWFTNDSKADYIHDVGNLTDGSTSAHTAATGETTLALRRSRDIAGALGRIISNPKPRGGRWC
jgi:hypothetical protein